MDLKEIQELVTVDGEKLITDTRKVARAFGKRHDNVLRAVDAMRDSGAQEIQEHYRLNFEAVEDLDAKGQLRRLYLMTKDGLSELAMSFTGEKARLTRIRFVQAFNAMAEYINAGRSGLWQQMNALLAKDADSKARASFGSHLMLDRKRQKPVFERQYAKLMAHIQQPLQLT